MNRRISLFSHKYFFISLVGVLFFSVFGYSTYTALSYLNYQNQQDSIHNAIHELKDFDESLTSHAIIYSLSQDNTYFIMYHQIVVQLDDLIDQSITLFPEIKNQLINLKTINQTLKTLEQEAFSLVEADQPDDAFLVFSQTLYLTNKSEYSNQLIQISSYLSSIASSYQHRFFSVLIASFLLFILFFIALLILLIRINHWTSKNYRYQKYIGNIAECLITNRNESLQTNMNCFLSIIEEVFKADFAFVSMIKTDQTMQHWISDLNQYSIQFNKDVYHQIKDTHADHHVIYIDQSSIQPSEKMLLNTYHLNHIVVCVSSFNHKMVFYGFANHNQSLSIKDVHHHFLVSVLDLLMQTYHKMNYEEELFYHATTDALTKIDNRRMIIEKLEKEHRLHTRYNKHGSIMSIDLDLFKNINDYFGHSVGDLVLKHFADITKQCLRDIDTFGRIGGEEFLVFLPNTSLKHTKTVAKRIQQALIENRFNYHNQPIEFTVSIGITHFTSDDLQLDDTLIRADQAMYLAKKNGRNRIEIKA